MQNGLKLWIFFSWTTICSGTIQVNKVIQFMIWLPLSLLYLQCIFCNCYNIDQGVFCKYSIEWWCGLCVEKVRCCQSTFILHTQWSVQHFYFDQIIFLIHFAYSARKNQQSLQPDKYHKLNKTGTVALWKPMRDLLFTSVLQALYFQSYDVCSSQTV